MRPSRRAVVLAGYAGDEATVRAGAGDPDPTVRALALGALDRLGALGDGDLADALRDGHASVRRRAAEIAAARPTVDLLASLDDPDASVAEQAAWSCGEHGSVRDDVLARLIELATTSPVALVRESCVAALGAIGDERGLDAILAGCRDSPAVRRRAVLALAPFEGPRVDAAIADALTDRDWQVRQAAEELTRAIRD